MNKSNLSNDIIKMLNKASTLSFLEAAKQFVELVGNTQISKEVFCQKAHCCLGDLYSAGQKLETVELKYSSSESDFKERRDEFFRDKNAGLISKLGKDCFYWEVFDPTYEKEVLSKYENAEVRLYYIDVGDIAQFIVEKKKAGDISKFNMFFENVEQILIYGDDYVKELIVIGLFEGIQNIGDDEIGYYKSFDHWLKLNSLKAWRGLIDDWEGKD